MLHIRLLGNFLVTYHNQPVVGLTRPQLKTALAYLALHPQSPLSKAELAKLFWRPTLDTQPAANLRNLLHYLRHELPGLEECIDFGKTLTWKPDAPYWLDVTAFEAALAQADTATDLGQQGAALVEALTLYTGDLWPQCQEEWIFPIRERLHSRYIDALEQLAILREGQRDYVGALQAAQRLLHETPLREESYRHVMHLHACLGDPVGIERTFQECRSQLLGKLKVEPSLPTRELYERLTQITPAISSRYSIPFVERQREWAHLQQVWGAVYQGRPHCILLTGDAGIGKTRLLTEFITDVKRQGMTAVLAQCQPFTLTVAYAPLLDWLRTPFLRRRIEALPPARQADLAPLLPDLAEEPDAPLSSLPLESWPRQRLYETLAQLFLAHDEPLLLALDNAQWCDQGTLDWLHYLLGTRPAAKLLLVGVLSVLELRPHYPVARLQPRLQQSRLVTELRLGPLTPEGVATLGQALIEPPFSAEGGTQLYRATEGNPLYVVEAIHALHADEKGLLDTHEIEAALLQLPVVQATVQLYFVALSTCGQEVAGLAATLGRSFTFELLAAAALIEHDTLLLALDELLQSHIILDDGEDGYTFSHTLLQRAAYAALSSARRRLWQGRVAQARQQLTKRGADNSR